MEEALISPWHIPERHSFVDAWQTRTDIFNSQQTDIKKVVPNKIQDQKSLNANQTEQNILPGRFSLKNRVIYTEADEKTQNGILVSMSNKEAKRKLFLQNKKKTASTHKPSSTTQKPSYNAQSLSKFTLIKLPSRVNNCLDKQPIKQHKFVSYQRQSEKNLWKKTINIDTVYKQTPTIAKNLEQRNQRLFPLLIKQNNKQCQKGKFLLKEKRKIYFDPKYPEGSGEKNRRFLKSQLQKYNLFKINLSKDSPSRLF